MKAQADKPGDILKGLWVEKLNPFEEKGYNKLSGKI